ELQARPGRADDGAPVPILEAIVEAGLDPARSGIVPFGWHGDAPGRQHLLVAPPPRGRTEGKLTVGAAGKEGMQAKPGRDHPALEIFDRQASRQSIVVETKRQLCPIAERPALLAVMLVDEFR